VDSKEEKKGAQMTSEIKPNEEKDQEMNGEHHHGGSSEAVYGLGLIGAWIYYISRAKTFREGVVGFLKGIVWPAFLVYALLEYLNKE
jgi:hypothetical protein